jgi:hypothetical protein
MQVNLRTVFAYVTLVVSSGISSAACIHPAAAGSLPEIPTPSVVKPPSSPAAPLVPPSTKDVELSEVACVTLVSVPGDGVGRIVLKNAGPAALDEYVSTVNNWFSCVPRFKAGPSDLRVRANEALKLLGSAVEDWYVASSPALHSLELIGTPRPVVMNQVVRNTADRRDVARAFWRVESELQTGRVLGGTTDTVARSSTPRDLGILMLRTDAVAGALSLALSHRDVEQPEIEQLLKDYSATLLDESRAWSTSGTQQGEGAGLDPIRPLARGAVGEGREYVASHLTYIDVSIGARVLGIQMQARLLGNSWGDRPSESLRDAVGVPLIGYLDVLSNISGAETINVDFLEPLPVRDGDSTVATGKVAWLAMAVRTMEVGNIRALFEFAQAEKNWETLLQLERPQGPLDARAYDDAQDSLVMGAVQALVGAAKHIIDPRIRRESVAQMATRINLEVQEAQRKDASVSPVRGPIRRRLSRIFSEVALCLIDSTIRNTPIADCELAAVDPEPTKTCDKLPEDGVTSSLPVLSGRARDGFERILQTLALHADLSASTVTMAGGATVGWTRRTRCALEMLATVPVYSRIGAGVRGDSSMLRLIAALQLRPSESSVRAIAISAFQNAQASLRHACFDSREAGCDEAVLARVVAPKKAPPIIKGGKKPPSVSEDERARKIHNLVAYCDAAFFGGYAYDALSKARPAGSVSIAKQYWNGTLPHDISNMGASVRAEASACQADPVLEQIQGAPVPGKRKR